MKFYTLKNSGVALTTRQIATDESNEHLANHNAAGNSHNSFIWRVVYPKVHILKIDIVNSEQINSMMHSIYLYLKL